MIGGQTGFPRMTTGCRVGALELQGSDALDELLDEARGHKRVVLLYSAKDEEHNQAVVLADLLCERL